MATLFTRLDSVNIILSNIGQAPVTVVDNDNPMVVMANNTLKEVSNSIQSEGWTFNTERAYPFQLDPNGKIAVPSNVLQLDTNYYSTLEIVQRNGYLYNKRDHTFIFDKSLDLDVVWLVDFDDMPPAFKQYITMRAANLFAGRATGSVENVRFGEREEAQARSAMMEYETSQGDYNFFGTADNRNYPTYRPSYTTIRF
jgi:hypothetical protein